jgi:ribonuclease P protein component
LIEPITRRQEFARLSREGRRRRQGCLWVAAIVSSDAGGVRVAFALPRKVGTAVERNRVRRRLRAAIGPLESQVPAGWYLIGVTRPAREISWEDVCTDLPAVLTGLAGR